MSPQMSEDPHPTAPPTTPHQQLLFETLATFHTLGLPRSTLWRVLQEEIRQEKPVPPPKRRIKNPPWLLLLITLATATIAITIATKNHAPCLLPSHPLVMEMIRPVSDCSFCNNSNTVLEIPSNATTINTSSWRELIYSGRPVIVRSNDNKVLLTFEELKGLFEGVDGGVVSVGEECQFLPFRSPFGGLGGALEGVSRMLAAGDRNRGEGEESVAGPESWYIGWSNCHPEVSKKLRSLFPRPTQYLPADSSPSAIDWIFMGVVVGGKDGATGRGAAMHIDYVRRPSWQLQLSGVKNWELRPPPECEGVCGGGAIRFRTRPGDLLFLETNLWFHQTSISLGDSEKGDGENKVVVAISIGSEYD